MLESYHEEIIRKKRAARIFWVIVFAFAGLLYFFFQGYYPDVQFRLANIGSGTVSGEERRLTIKSFGIVNIKTTPENFDLRLNDAPYGNNEKKMVDYGDYTFTISGEGYIPGKMSFNIDNEKPYYIDLLTVIPKPNYLPYSRKFDQVAKTGENSWITQDASGMTLFEGGFSTGILISSKRFAHIGEGYFLSGNTIMSYDTLEHTWTLEKDSEWGALAKRCPSVTVKNALLFCPKTGEVVFPSGKALTGILDIGNNYLTTKTSLIITENNRVKKTLSLSGSRNDASDFISVDDTWYFSENGKLLPIGTGSQITTPLESIKYMEWVDGELLLFGKRGKDTFLSLFDVNAPENSRTIPFPDISLGAIKIWKTAGNLFIKTEGALLFIYHGSDETQWMIDGSIITAGDTTALYEKDGKIWKASWKEVIQ